MSRPSGVPVFERFFRSVASIQIDKNDVRRFRDFVDLGAFVCGQVEIGALGRIPARRGSAAGE